MLIFLRSLAFNLAFYLNTAFWLIIAIPTFLMPYWGIVAVAKLWGRSNLVLLRILAGIHADFRGLDKLPPGGFIAAAKHQSAWDTFALLWMFRDPTFILKRELQWIPLFGWFTIKGRMIPVDRGGGSQALTAMNQRAHDELAHGRQIVIFPEGTRRAVGAEPRYKYGVAYLYEVGEVPCVPIALNSGLFWPRRTFLRYPGTVIVDVLDPIPPGLPRDEFFARLQGVVETATARLIAEAKAAAR
ncbi:MAG: lysophospholipid acyltransferase family protein [Pseudolabrys sp.]